MYQWVLNKKISQIIQYHYEIKLFDSLCMKNTSIVSLSNLFFFVSLEIINSMLFMYTDIFSKN